MKLKYNAVKEKIHLYSLISECVCAVCEKE